jgi:beta-phosphoglucomutase family hydrolase
MTSPRLPLSSTDTRDKLLSLRGVLFDLDGVLTPTVDVHKRAWDLLFTPFLEVKGVTEPYTDADYHKYVDGKPRYDGVRSLLQSRGIELPEGETTDDPSEETICGLGNRKNAAFSKALEEDGVKPYPGSLNFLQFVVDAGLDVAVVTSSRNGEMVLEAAGLRDRFDVVVDGMVSAKQKLDGKPSPATYAYAAEQLGYSAEECVVIEDAQSGVQAGRAGNFGLVLGVDRGIGVDALMEHGADSVDADLGELVPESESAAGATSTGAAQ